MRILGWPEETDSDGAILPVNIVDVDFHGTADELRLIAHFLLKAATELDHAQANNLELNIGIDLDNSNPDARVGIWVNVIREVDK
jgi:hypothetical protein